MKKKYLTKDIILWTAILATAVVVLGLIGPPRFFWATDSKSYYPLQNAHGVMLGYPLFLEIIKNIFGSKNCLDIVVIIQVLVAIICTVDFVAYIKREFLANRIETFILYLLLLYPFTINYPESITTHEIMTEALTYPLFYPYIKFLLKAITNNKMKFMVPNIFFAFILSMIRSQLKLVWIISAAGFFYVACKNAYKKKRATYYMMLMLVTGCAFIMALLIVSKTDQGIRKIIFYDKNVMVSTEEPVLLTEKEVVNKTQWDDVIFARGMYAADESDISLFSEPELKEIYNAVFQEIDKKQYRDVYSREGIWKWKDIAQGYGQNPSVGAQAITRYYAEKHFESIDIDKQTTLAYKAIGSTLLKKHWVDYIMQTMYFLPSGFVSTIFFQKEEIYELCHIITLLLYVLALGSGVYALNKNKRIGESMLTVVFVNIVFVTVTNLVYMGLQRYLIYSFGLFYVNLYFAIKIIFKDLIVNKRK